MADCVRCPHCGSDDTSELNIHDELWCGYCGSWWWAKDRDSAHVPRRSRLPEVLRYPSDHGYWWEWHDAHREWKVVHCLSLETFAPGRYVRAVPPILPPEPPRDADTEWLRAYMTAWQVKDLPCSNGEVAARLKSIADRLEARKEPT